MISVIFFIFFATASHWGSFAQAQANVPNVTTSNSEDFLSEGETLVSRTHAELSDGVVTLSQKVDALIGRGEPVETTDRSHIDLIFLTNATEHDDPTFKTRIKSNIVLPRTQRRFNLILHNLSEHYRDESIITSQSQLRDSHHSPESAASAPSYSTALRYMVSARDHLRVNTDAGIRMTVPLDPYWQVKASQSLDGGPLELTFTEQGHWFRSTGLAASLGLRLDRALGRSLHLRQSNLATWTAAKESMEIEQGLSLYQVLPKARTLTYFLSLTSRSEPNLHISTIEYGTSLRSSAIWPWLSFELTLMNSYLRETQFSAEPSLALQLQVRI